MSEPAHRDDSPDERARIRAELEAEHEARVERFAARKAAARERAGERKDIHKRRELEQLRQDERRRFYKEKGYREYVDSNGRSEWLTPEEYEWRMRRRRKRDRRGREYRPSLLKRRRELAIYAVAALAALLIGLILVR